MRKKRIPEAMATSVMSLYQGAKTRVRVDSEMLDKFEVKVGLHQGSVMSPFCFAVVADVVTESAIEGVLWELQYAEDLVLKSEIFDGIRS